MPERPRKDIPLIQLLPNMLTIVAICAGLSAIRFGAQGEFKLAVQLIVLAAVLDGMDGRIARHLRCSSKMGAELDSLADFLNFGVAPPLLLYFWGLQDLRSFGWIAVLVFAVCCIIRLARFNVDTKVEADEGKGPAAYFTGIPSPAGALLVMLPMYISFAFAGAPLVPDLLIGLYMIVIGYLMISRLPTWSFKALRIPREKVRLFLVAVAFGGAALVLFAWESLIVICLGYVGMVIWTGLHQARSKGE